MSYPISKQTQKRVRRLKTDKQQEKGEDLSRKQKLFRRR